MSSAYIHIYIYTYIYLSSINEYVSSSIIILYINIYNVQFNQTALHFAAEYGTTAAIETLINAGADIMALDKVKIGICMHVHTCMGCTQYI